ncbi:hypothetical protein [Mucilaginibacter xinganensis]|uniref:Stationary phase survival protein SurE n=1 Tax=Mucilaginibacter xinganensis TaxID=1234841 RepID=A0A223P2X8_9SPHI|nr:hypothetical protein [Mucilaginibacter xinganensis]ASU36426.1 hypothetical protein MuYL_4541 [Mucilaginibacter xinganensis]
MLNKNGFFTGVLAGIIFPVIAWITAYYFSYNIYIINKPALPFFVAIALNLIMMRILLKKEFDQTARGIMLATFIVMLLVFIFKVHLR